MQGYGKMSFSIGGFYNGSWDLGRASGRGEFIDDIGKYYSGMFNKGIPIKAGDYNMLLIEFLDQSNLE